ncbi:MAG: hypothetical protein M0Q49_05600 [Porticoccaceae bacterium]|nr:hypothetical protein [Porticoccaceae bacterium]
MSNGINVPDTFGNATAEAALVLRIVRGFGRGETSDWALKQINTYTDSPAHRARLRMLVRQEINARGQ